MQTGWALSQGSSRGKFPCSSEQSPHKRLLGKYREVKRNTLVTAHVCFLECCLQNMATLWHTITFWREGWRRQCWSPLLRVYNRCALRKNWPGCSLPQQSPAFGAWVTEQIGLREPRPFWHPLFKTSRAGSPAHCRTYLPAACEPGELLALANQICTFSSAMQGLPGRSSPTFARMTRNKMQRKWTTKAACELHTGMSCVGVAFLFPMRGSDWTWPRLLWIQTGSHTSQLVNRLRSLGVGFLCGFFFFFFFSFCFALLF